MELSRDIYINTVSTTGTIYKISTEKRVDLNIFFVSVSNDTEISIDKKHFNKSVILKFIRNNKQLLNKTKSSSTRIYWYCLVLSCIYYSI